MKYNRFEELPVWQDAIQLAVQIFDLTSQPEFKGYFSLKDQIERAGVSVSNNIAEGFERGTTFCGVLSADWFLQCDLRSQI
jgi:hypothetical protein